MRGKKIFLCLLIIVSSLYGLQAQRAKYTAIEAGYDPEVPDKMGKNLHVWSSTEKKSFFSYSKTTLLLSVLSPDLNFIAEKRLLLGKIRTWSIDFKYTDTCYYARIFYQAEAGHLIILKVGEDGSISDAGSSSGRWPSRDSVVQVNKIFAIKNSGSKMYTIKADNENYAGEEETNNIYLGNEIFNAGKNFKTITIKKIDHRGKTESAQVYASAFMNFSYPFLSVTDTGIIAASFADPDSRNNKDNPYHDPYLFFTFFSSSAEKTTSGHALLKIAKAGKSEQYAPAYLFRMHGRLFFIYNGWDPNSYLSMPPVRNGIFMYQTQRFYSPTINSLRLIAADEKNNLLKDTVLNDHGQKATIDWENKFVITSPDQIDLFLSIRYRGSKTGITHINIDSNGNIKQEDIIVELRYEYLLTKAKKITENSIAVPYKRWDKTSGVVQFSYGD